MCRRSHRVSTAQPPSDASNSCRSSRCWVSPKLRPVAARHRQFAFSGNCLAIAPASASAIMSMCCLHRGPARWLRRGIVRHDLFDLLRVVRAVRQQQAAHGVFGQVRIGAGEELGDLAGVGGEIGHRLGGTGASSLAARVGQRLDRAPMAAEQFHHAIAAGLAIEAGHRVADLVALATTASAALLASALLPACTAIA